MHPFFFLSHNLLAVPGRNVEFIIVKPVGTALQAGRSRIRFPLVSAEFLIDIILSATLWPWG